VAWRGVAAMAKSNGVSVSRRGGYVSMAGGSSTGMAWRSHVT